MCLARAQTDLGLHSELYLLTCRQQRRLEALREVQQGLQVTPPM